ncbi:hypothetical protein CW304_25385 [Bacillus sp. UFRGS-B20]|nr:hypothetical protein CW304_25385 [Bacillus sp. UFRGS-B20]
MFSQQFFCVIFTTASWAALSSSFTSGHFSIRFHHAGQSPDVRNTYKFALNTRAFMPFFCCNSLLIPSS